MYTCFTQTSERYCPVKHIYLHFVFSMLQFILLQKFGSDFLNNFASQNDQLMDFLPDCIAFFNLGSGNKTNIRINC